MTTASVRTGRSHLTGRLITDYSTPAEVVSGANGEFDAPAPEPAGGVVASVRARSTNVSALGAFASMGAAALCLAFSPQVGSDTFTPKLAIILLFGAAVSYTHLDVYKRQQM